jgi:hypothetical protein
VAKQHTFFISGVKTIDNASFASYDAFQTSIDTILTFFHDYFIRVSAKLFENKKSEIT